jgi:hypothetical protein
VIYKIKILMLRSLRWCILYQKLFVPKSTQIKLAYMRLRPHGRPPRDTARRDRDIEAAEVDESAPASILLNPNKTITRGSAEMLNYVKPLHQPDDVLQEILNLHYVILETSV